MKRIAPARRAFPRGAALRRVLAVATVVAAAGIGCTDDGGRPDRGRRGRPDILLVTIDTFRADHLHAAGYPRPTTPTLDSLAATGALFLQAISPAPETAPSHASLLTGTYPPAHAVRSNGIYALPEELTTLAELLGASGYDTGAFVGSFVLDRRFGLAQGFAAYDDSMPESDTPAGPGGVWYGNIISRAFERRAASVTDSALRWVESLRRGPGAPPLFLWVHYYDPHAPYDPPSEHDVFPKHDPANTYAKWEAIDAAKTRLDPAERTRLFEDLVARYDGEIRYCDEEVARLIARLRAAGLSDDTIVIVTSDHGESLVEDEYFFRHGWYLHENVLRVPLVLSWPGRIPPGSVVHGQVELIDVFATIALAAGIEASQLPGVANRARDLVPLAVNAAALSPVMPAAVASPATSSPATSSRPTSPSAASPSVPADVGKPEAYSETFLRRQLVGGRPLFALRTPRWKYIETEPEEGRRRSWLYDLESAGPPESENLAKTSPAIADSLAAGLHAILAEETNDELAETNRLEPDAATIEKLRALGYIK